MSEKFGCITMDPPKLNSLKMEPDLFGVRCSSSFCVWRFLYSRLLARTHRAAFKSSLVWRSERLRYFRWPMMRMRMWCVSPEDVEATLVCVQKPQEQQCRHLVLLSNLSNILLNPPPHPQSDRQLVPFLSLLACRW